MARTICCLLSVSPWSIAAGHRAVLDDDPGHDVGPSRSPVAQRLAVSSYGYNRRRGVTPPGHTAMQLPHGDSLVPGVSAGAAPESHAAQGTTTTGRTARRRHDPAVFYSGDVHESEVGARAPDK